MDFTLDFDVNFMEFSLSSSWIALGIVDIAVLFLSVPGVSHYQCYFLHTREEIGGIIMEIVDICGIFQIFYPSQAKLSEDKG